MKILKRTLGLILVLVFTAVCSNICVAAAADSEDTDIEFLHELGIFTGYEDGNLHPDWSITRMEFAALVIRCLGYDGGFNELQTPFWDVSADSWGAGYVRMAHDLKIINGYTDGSFRPDNPVTVAEAIKMMVCALGYGDRAEKLGGFPHGYVGEASRLKIADSIAALNTPATRGYVASLIENSLEIFIAEQAINSDSITKTEETILSRLDISVREGVLTSYYGGDISGNNELEAGEIVISGEKFASDITVPGELLGKEVKLYVYDYKGDDEKLLVIVPKSYSGKELVINASDIEPETTLTNLVYTENGKRRTQALPANITISYNGRLIDNSADYTDSRLKPASGEVRLYDTDANGSYDLAVVKDYQTIVVRTVTDSGIYGVFGNYVKTDDETVLFVKYNDEYTSVDEIQSEDVLSAAVSLDGEVAELIIHREITEGVVSAMEETDEGVIYTLDNGQELRASREYGAALSGGYNMAEKIELGSDMLFHLNYFGEIAAAQINTAAKGDGEYGYIMAMGEAGSSVNNIYEIEILTTNNRYEIFKTAKKVTFGRSVEQSPQVYSYNISKTTPDEIFNTVYFEGQYITRQMVMYRLDANGDIKELYLRDMNTDTDNFSYDVTRGSKRVVNNLIDGRYYIDDDTDVFHIPLDAQYRTHLSAGKSDDYFTSSGSYTLELYDVEPNGHVNCILYTDSSTGRALSEGGTWHNLDYVNSPVMLVTRVYNEVSEDGTDWKIIEGWENKTKVRRLMSDSLSAKASNIKAGSVIQYATNASDALYAETAENDITIVVYTHLFDCNDISADEFMLYDYTIHEFANPRIKFGYTGVSRVDYPYIYIGYDSTIAKMHGGTMVYVYDTETKEVRTGDIGDINEGNKIFVRLRYSNLREIIVIE